MNQLELDQLKKEKFLRKKKHHYIRKIDNSNDKLIR